MVVLILGIVAGIELAVIKHLWATAEDRAYKIAEHEKTIKYLSDTNERVVDGLMRRSREQAERLENYFRRHG